ncbi:hypothetical protein [Halovivax sp.]|uniref:DUF7331 family protein n=1 Tax=Halovivax sp. TaxID=1935978 RepID=UPI0025C06EBA|nr:hypothetical protein [Halovivax sp.]
MSTDAQDRRSFVATYDDGEYVVLVDRRNPRAWLRSDVSIPREDVERDRIAPV